MRFYFIHANCLLFYRAILSGELFEKFEETEERVQNDIYGILIKHLSSNVKDPTYISLSDEPLTVSIIHAQSFFHYTP